MADVDIDPFGEHESTTDDHTETGENIPFTPSRGRINLRTRPRRARNFIRRRISKNQTNERLH